MKRVTASFLALLMIFCFSGVSESLDAPETYVPVSRAGGVINRGPSIYRTRGLISQLDVAYLETDTPYMQKGVETNFTIHASGGDGRFTYSFSLYRRRGNSGMFYHMASEKQSSSNTFAYTPVYSKGQYLLIAGITDSRGSYLEWQSQVFESGSSAACKKAKEIAEECMMQADTDYERALWLHDWLIYNADYDRQYEYFYPEGVLLYGKGVCQSYALAYDMLLKLVGIECVYLVGYAGGDAHGWNLVNINGSWSHVDCTWDDPSNGVENHNYFCLSDEVMSRDHYWMHETPILPACNDTQRM